MCEVCSCMRACAISQCQSMGLCSYTMRSFSRPLLNATMLTSQLYYARRGLISSAVQAMCSVSADLVQFTQNRTVRNGTRCWHSKQQATDISNSDKRSPTQAPEISSHSQSKQRSQASQWKSSWKRKSILKVGCPASHPTVIPSVPEAFFLAGSAQLGTSHAMDYMMYKRQMADVRKEKERKGKGKREGKEHNLLRRLWQSAPPRALR
jgi:hypothetical protein